MIQGHVVMHLAMFGSSYFIDVSPYSNIPQGSTLHEEELFCFYLLRWGHLCTAIL